MKNPSDHIKFSLPCHTEALYMKDKVEKWR